MNAEHWRRLCASRDDMRPSLALPWVRDGRTYASDGVALYSAGETAARGHDLNESTEPGIGPPPKAPQMLADAHEGTRHEAELWPLMRWAGPLASARYVCDTCEGLGTLAWVGCVCGDDDCAGDLAAGCFYGGPEYVGPSDERPGGVPQSGDCAACDGAGWVDPPVESVSVYGVTIDAARLARALWALVRLDHMSADPIVACYVGTDRILFARGHAEVLLMGMTADQTPLRRWLG